MTKRMDRTFSVRIDEEGLRDLEAVAKAMGITPADVARMCLRLALPLVKDGTSYTQSLFRSLRPKMPPKAK